MEVESVDRGGNFIGWLYMEGRNLTQLLVEEGLGKVHASADRWVDQKPSMWEGHVGVGEGLAVPLRSIRSQL